MKGHHEKELEDQKEDYGNLLREESSKWKIQREELENEISKLKKFNTATISTTPMMMTRGQSSKSQEADLTAIIKDLNESSELLSSNVKKRSNSTIGRNNNNNSFTNTNTSNVRKTSHFLIWIYFYF